MTGDAPEGGDCSPDAAAGFGRLDAVGTYLVYRLSSWTARSWQHESASGRRTDLVVAAIQQLADIGADAEARPRRDVPSLPADPPAGPGAGLTDPLAVMVGDVSASGDRAAAATATDILERLVRNLQLPRRR